jgi:hypothetical protein
MLAFVIHETRRLVLRHVRGEEHLLLRSYLRAATASILSFALTLFPCSPRDHIAAQPVFDPNYEDSTLNRCAGISEADKLQDIAQLLASLWEAAQRLPEGSERHDAFREIGSFQKRAAVLVTRAP